MQVYSYYYEHNYHLEEEAEKGPCKRYFAVYPHRKLLPRDRKYYMNCLTMNIQDPDISIFKLGIDVAPPYYTIKNRLGNSLFFSFVLDGAGRVNEARFESGDLYYTVPMQKHTLSSDNQTPWSTVWVMIAGNYTKEVLEMLGNRMQKQSVKYTNPDDVLKVAEFFIYSAQPSGNVVQYVKGIVQTLLSYAVCDYTEEDINYKISFSVRRMIFKVKDEINRNLSTCTVSSIADKVHLERKYFCKLFTAVTGTTPQNYILECKMNWVKNTLLQSTLSIDEIVSQIGYSHRNSLLIAFKKRFGCPPSEFRKKNAEKKADAQISPPQDKE